MGGGDVEEADSVVSSGGASSDVGTTVYLARGMSTGGAPPFAVFRRYVSGRAVASSSAVCVDAQVYVSIAPLPRLQVDIR